MPVNSAKQWYYDISNINKYSKPLKKRRRFWVQELDDYIDVKGQDSSGGSSISGGSSTIGGSSTSGGSIASGVSSSGISSSGISSSSGSSSSSSKVKCSSIANPPTFCNSFGGQGLVDNAADIDCYNNPCSQLYDGRNCCKPDQKSSALPPPPQPAHTTQPPPSSSILYRSSVAESVGSDSDGSDFEEDSNSDSSSSGIIHMPLNMKNLGILGDQLAGSVVGGRRLSRSQFGGAHTQGSSVYSIPDISDKELRYVKSSYSKKTSDGKKLDPLMISSEEDFSKYRQIYTEVPDTYVDVRSGKTWAVPMSSGYVPFEYSVQPPEILITGTVQIYKLTDFHDINLVPDENKLASTGVEPLFENIFDFYAKLTDTHFILNEYEHDATPILNKPITTIKGVDYIGNSVNFKLKIQITSNSGGPDDIYLFTTVRGDIIKRNKEWYEAFFYSGTSFLYKHQHNVRHLQQVVEQ